MEVELPILSVVELPSLLHSVAADTLLAAAQSLSLDSKSPRLPWTTTSSTSNRDENRTPLNVIEHVWAYPRRSLTDNLPPTKDESSPSDQLYGKLHKANGWHRAI